MRSRAFTLLELLIALAIGGILVSALTMAFFAATQYELRAPETRRRDFARYEFEDRLRTLLAHAYVSDNANDGHTYFFTEAGDDNQLGNDFTGAPGLTWTALGLRTSASALESDEADFVTRNETFGPIGGVTELTLSETPIGDDAPADQIGVFLREQRPADDDPYQGGYESLLSDRASSLIFEFYDGLEWLSDWTTQDGDRTMPAAIRVTYVWDGDTERPFQVIVNLLSTLSNQQAPSSGVTP